MTMSPHRLRPPSAVLGVAVLVTAAPVLGAQTAETGRVVGTIVDAATGRPIASADILLVRGDTIRVRTGPDGTWTARLVAGTWQVTARRLGHAPAVRTIRVDRRDTAPVRLALVALPQALDQTVVTAARREQRLADAVTAIEVITRGDIERTGSTDLAAVLVEQTGIQLQGGHPSGTGVMLQGLGSERVLILLDGQPIAGRLSGVFDVSRIPVAVVERVEVVKGPQSTLYGTEAMGGVINIITRTPARGATDLSVASTVGTQARRDGGASVGVARGAFATQLDVQRRHVDMTPGRASPDGALSARTDGAVKLRWSPDSSMALEANLLALDERQRWRTGSFFSFADNRQINARVGGVVRRGGHRFAPTASVSEFEHVSRGSRLALPIAGDTGRRQLQRTMQAELVYDAPLPRSGALTLGTQLRRDAIAAERVTGGPRELTLIEPFAQAEVSLTPRLVVSPGVRVSHSAQWGTRATPRLAARLRATDGITVRASVGDGFRVPEFKELFMFFTNTNAGYAVLGNTDLRPEWSRNASLGADWSGALGFVRVQGFHTSFHDFIETRPVTQPGEAPVFRFSNVDDGRITGADVETGLVLGGWRVDAGYGHLATRNAATGLPLLGRPAHSGRLALLRTLPGGMRTSLTAIATGRTPMERDSTGAVSSWREAFVRVDVRLARRLASGLEFAIGADNLLDTQPAQWAGFTRRHVYTAVTWRHDRAPGR